MGETPLPGDVNFDVMRSRQAWFWRRTTLQAALAALTLILGYSVVVTAGLELSWKDVAVQCALTAGIVWLVTMYFAMVDSADKLSAAARAIGDGVGAART